MLKPLHLGCSYWVLIFLDAGSIVTVMNCSSWPESTHEGCAECVMYMPTAVNTAYYPWHQPHNNGNSLSLSSTSAATGSALHTRRLSVHELGTYRYAVSIDITQYLRCYVANWRTLQVKSSFWRKMKKSSLVKSCEMLTLWSRSSSK
jgi:hypothetical protein